MFRAPTTDLWHFEHVFLPPYQLQSESLEQALSSPWRFGDQGQSYVAVPDGGAGFDGLTKFHWAVLGIPYLELHSVPPLTDDPS